MKEKILAFINQPHTPMFWLAAGLVLATLAFGLIALL